MFEKIWRSRQLYLATMVVLLLFCWGLRLYDIAALQIHGDSAYSVYYAVQDLASITRGQINDSHPPLYYYVLHFTGIFAGYNEVAMRYPSIAAGMLTVSLLYRFGRVFWQSHTIGLGAAFLFTVSPFALFYNRMPRMYALMTLLSVLSVYLLVRAIHAQRAGRYLWGMYGLVTLAAIYMHYYAAWLIPVALVYGWWASRIRLRDVRIDRLPRLLGTPFGHLASTICLIVLGFVPWLLIALTSAVSATAKTISNAPPAQGIIGYIEQIILPYASGVTLPIEQERIFVLALLPVALGAVLAWSDAQRRTNRVRTVVLPLVWWIVPVLVMFLIFLVAPYLVRQRFFLYIYPAALLLAMAGIVALWQRAKWAGIVAMLVLSGAYLISSVQVVRSEPYMMEPDAVQLTRHLEGYARPGDVLVLQAFWQEGYLKAHYRGPELRVLGLRDIPATGWRDYTGTTQRVWLAMYNTGERDPLYPLEQSLDQNMGKLDARTFGLTRLALYTPYERTTEPRGTELQLIDAANQTLFTLSAPRLRSTNVPAGDALAVRWTWRAVRPNTTRYTVYLQLRDATGRTWVGRDSEPQSGVVPTMGWQSGDSHEDIRGLLLPPHIPPGSYVLVMGVYETGSGAKTARLRTTADLPAQPEVEIGRITVLTPDMVSPAHRQDSRMADGVVLRGHTLEELDRPPVQSVQRYTALLDHPLTLTSFKQSYKRGETMHLSLFWSLQGSGTLTGNATARLTDAEGRPVVQTSTPLNALSYHPLTIPQGISAGRYRLEVIVSTSTTPQASSATTIRIVLVE